MRTASAGDGAPPTQLQSHVLGYLEHRAEVLLEREFQVEQFL